MASERVAFSRMHPRRSQEAFAALMEDWSGLLGSDGYGVYQQWGPARLTGWARGAAWGPGGNGPNARGEPRPIAAAERRLLGVGSSASQADIEEPCPIVAREMT